MQPTHSAGKWVRSKLSLGFLFGLILLHAAVLVAVKARSRKVAQLVHAAIHFCLLVFDGEASWASPRKVPPAVATFPALTPVKLTAHPGTILKVSQISHVPAERGPRQRLDVNPFPIGWGAEYPDMNARTFMLLCLWFLRHRILPAMKMKRRVHHVQDQPPRPAPSLQRCRCRLDGYGSGFRRKAIGPKTGTLQHIACAD